ncbi:hypothetical protein B1A_13295 [mine drainage metagenome]|uniref:BrnA antitoxin family protein n=1 Tax=mine drainage metagenome TaxID=410659 RepID=T1A1X0_9ZZZZ
MSNATTGKTVRFSLDPNTPLSAEEKAQLTALKDRPIDLSDIPESPADAEWTRPGALIPDTKQQVTLRLDRDVLDYFRHTGKRYQTRINSVLRAYMQAHEAKR